MDIARPFVRLPFAFDAKRLADEAAALPASAWMAHPNRMTGNSAVALISRDGGDNDDFDGRMQTTPHLEACPYIGQAIASFGEVFGRSRLMKLAAGAEVSTHVDFNYHWYTRERILVTPQALQLCDTDGEIALDYIGRYENLQQSFDRVCEQIGISTSDLSQKNPSKHAAYTAYYDDELRGLVSEFYKDDLAIFGYDFEPSGPTN